MSDKTRCLVNLVTYAAGFLAVGVGGVVMLGWEMHWARVVQIYPAFAPMQFNTALCIALTGASIVLARSRGAWRIAAAAFAALAAFLIILIGSQYITGTDLGIDTAFVTPYLTTKTASPGRTSPNTSFCILLLSVGLLAWHLSKNKESRLVVSLLCAGIVSFLSGMALIGYIFNIESAYNWWSFSGMAPHTATCLLAGSMGMGAMVYGARQDWEHGYRHWWHSAATLVVGMLLTFAVSQIILVNIRHNAEELASLELSRTIEIIQIDLAKDAQALRRMKDRWEMSGFPGTTMWEQDAKNYLRDNSSYRAFALMDSKHEFRDFMPESNAALWKKWNDEGRFRKIREDAVLVSRLPGADSSLIVFSYPLRQNGQLSGYLFAAYDFKKEINKIPLLDADTPTYIEIADDNGVIFSNLPERRNSSWEITRQGKLTYHDLSWTVRQTLNAADSGDSRFALAIFLAGMILSVVLALMVAQAARVRRFAIETEKTRNLMAAIVASSDDAIVSKTLDGIITSWNRGAERLFGYSAAEAVGHHISLIIPPDRAHEEDEFVSQISRGTPVEHFETLRKTKQGRALFVSLAISPIYDGAGKVVGASKIARDITESKKAEEELKRSNQELERFAYVASHDLKTPLRNIDDLAKWVVDDTQDILPPDAREKMDLLRNRVAGLERLLADILAYSRVGRIVDPPSEIDTHELVSQIADTHVPDSFEITIKDRLPVLFSSRTPLEQIFGNLIANAVKHHGGKKGRIEVESHDRGDFCEFVIRDDGAGIPVEFRERVFQMFQTLQSRDKVDGSGLGLAIVKKLVEWRGGRIWIEFSDPAQSRGTEMHFLWPYRQN